MWTLRVLCGGVCPYLCLCVRPALPRPSPNLRSDVAPSYSTFPCVSFPSRQSWGSLAARPPTPADTARRAGGGTWTYAPSPFLPPLAFAGRRGRGGGPGLVPGQPTPPRFPLLYLCPHPVWGLGRDQTQVPGRHQCFSCAPSTPFVLQLSRLATLSHVGREL